MSPNSGTYNNQWMVVDYERFRESPRNLVARSGVLWVAEQVPGKVVVKDQVE